MSRRSRYDKDDGRTGNALKDGYTCFGESPRTARATTFMSHKDAEAFDAETKRMAEWERFSTPRRRFPTYTDDDILD